MNPLKKAVDDCKFRIPRQILESVFIHRDQMWRAQPTTIDAHIINEVIRPRVLVDCNLIGGAELIIPLAGITPERIDAYTSVYRIPKARTGGRAIMSVLNVTFSDPTAAGNYGTSTGCQSTQLMLTAQALIDSQGSIPVTSNAHAQLIGENTVMIRDTMLLPANIYLRAIVANDENMNHLQMRYIRSFSELCIYAVQAYIYNEYIIQMDIGELHGGQTLGKFREIVESYADADELYRTFLREKMGKIFVMNDTESYTRFLRGVLGGRR